jgi:hypothetical protein
MLEQGHWHPKTVPSGTYLNRFSGSGSLFRAIYHSYGAKQSKKNLSARIIFFVLPVDRGQVKTAPTETMSTIEDNP